MCAYQLPNMILPFVHCYTLKKINQDNRFMEFMDSHFNLRLLVGRNEFTDRFIHYVCILFPPKRICIWVCRYKTIKFCNLLIENSRKIWFRWPKRYEGESDMWNLLLLWQQVIPRLNSMNSEWILTKLISTRLFEVNMMINPLKIATFHITNLTMFINSHNDLVCFASVKSLRLLFM